MERLNKGEDVINALNSGLNTQQFKVIAYETTKNKCKLFTI